VIVNYTDSEWFTGEELEFDHIRDEIVVPIHILAHDLALIPGPPVAQTIEKAIVISTKICETIAQHGLPWNVRERVTDGNIPRVAVLKAVTFVIVDKLALKL
jgi:hypothetical protein